MAQKVAIIGAGCSGLAAIKSCLEEGLKPFCFEREDDIGGLWNYSEETKPGKGSIYRSCVINTSKEMIAFSDFPVPASFPPFMPHACVLRYFRLYADKFDLLRHIQFNTSVENVARAPDFAESGRWHVTLRKSDDSQSDHVTVEEFDAVMVCTGHHVYPHLPDFPGMANFKGVRIHSQDYKRPEGFEDKKVLVVGIGNSAVDIAVDVSRTAEQVYLSTRRGAWIVSRMGPLGFPADALANSRFLFSLPTSWLQSVVELMCNFQFNHRNYGVQARHRALEAHPTINDELPHRIMVGKVQVRPNISRFTTNGVYFDDGTYQDIDAVVMATGYDYHFRFLDESILKTQDNRVDLYKYIFPPHLPHHTLGIIGLVQAIGAVIPISEMQSRLFTRVVKRLVPLPDADAMMSDIREKQTTMNARYLPSRRHTLQTFWIPYMDELASLVRVKPRLWTLALRDPWLALRCFFGPCIPAQYRLQGAGQWAGAPDAIRSACANNIRATRTRTVDVATTCTQDKCMPKFVRDLVQVLLLFLLIAGLYQICLNYGYGISDSSVMNIH